MKYLINLLILGAIAFLGYMLYNGINEPIKFRSELSKRQNVVVTKLEQIRTSQELYREITGEFAPSFEQLANVLKTDSLPFRQLIADPEDPENPDKFIVNIIYFNALDSINALGIDLDNLQYVPYSNKSSSFAVQADTMTYQQTLVPVVEVMTRYSEFMGAFADDRFSMYEKNYNPNNRLGFGSMSSPNLEGNWK